MNVAMKTPATMEDPVTMILEISLASVPKDTRDHCVRLTLVSIHVCMDCWCPYTIAILKWK